MGQGRELGLSPPGDSHRLGCRFRSLPAPLHHFLRGRTRLCHHESNDTFHDGNSYAESSASRLLVMGREYGNPLPDKGYIFWGDDNGPLTTYTSPADTLWHIMHHGRYAAMYRASADSTSVRWNGTGMTVTRKGFLDTIEQDSSATEAFAVTPALPGRELAISFYCPLSHPTFDAGFTGSGGNTCEYGYRFDREGNVSAISGGTGRHYCCGHRSQRQCRFHPAGKTGRFTSALTVSAARRVPFPNPKPPAQCQVLSGPSPPKSRCA